MKPNAVLIAYVILAAILFLGLFVLAGVSAAQENEIAIAIACVESGGTWDGYGSGKCTR